MGPRLPLVVLGLWKCLIRYLITQCVVIWLATKLTQSIALLRILSFLITSYLNAYAYFTLVIKRCWTCPGKYKYQWLSNKSSPLLFHKKITAVDPEEKKSNNKGNASRSLLAIFLQLPTWIARTDLHINIERCIQWESNKTNKKKYREVSSLEWAFKTNKEMQWRK